MALEIGNSIWVLCETGQDFQPYSYFDYKSWKDRKNTDALKVDGYKHWLSIFNDVWGFYVDVFYSEKTKKGEAIELMIFHPKGRKKLEQKRYDFLGWQHETSGLFATEILPILEKY